MEIGREGWRGQTPENQAQDDDMTKPSLRDIALDTSALRVTDELAALDGLVPEVQDDMQRHAALLERLPSLLEIAGRSRIHASEYQRLLVFAEVDPSALEDWIDTANALAILSHASEIVMLLVPAATAEDRFVKSMLVEERVAQYLSGQGMHDPKLMERALGGRPRWRASARSNLPVPPAMTEVARRFRGEIAPDSAPEVAAGPVAHRLKDALALETWFAAPPDLHVLLHEALALFARVQAWSSCDAGASRYGARRGAMILAYARLCRIGLWPAHSPADLKAKREVARLISERTEDPDPMRALVEIALGVGRRIAGQGEPFLSDEAGVEL